MLDTPLPKHQVPKNAREQRKILQFAVVYCTLIVRYTQVKLGELVNTIDIGP